ncbi:MAG: sporulation protein YjcZ [Gorillibacterium sp.]|nr:sporulation protein YjcZ [Gorillibacterium sp.]
MSYYGGYGGGCGPCAVTPVVGGYGTGIGIVLVLYILLVIILKAFI